MSAHTSPAPSEVKDRKPHWGADLEQQVVEGKQSVIKKHGTALKHTSKMWCGSIFVVANIMVENIKKEYWKCAEVVSVT